MTPSRSSRLPALTIDVIDGRPDGNSGSRIAAFAAACGDRRGIQLEVDGGTARLSIDAKRIEQLGPRIEAAASAQGLTIRIPDLDAEVVAGGLDQAPSRTWIALGRAVLEAEIAQERGAAQPFEPFQYVKVIGVEGRRQLLANLPPLVEGSQPPDDAYMSEPGFLGDLGPTKYDDVGWHVDATLEAKRPTEQAFTHIGLYLAWLIRNDLYDRRMLPRTHVAAVKQGEMTGSDLADDIDGKLVSDMLNGEGRAFTDHYYSKYLRDYGLVFEAEPDYGVADTPEAYARVAPMLDEALRDWIESGRPGPAPADPDEVIETPARLRGTGLPDSMTRAELDAYMDAAFENGEVQMVRVTDLPRPHEAPELERIILERLGIGAPDVWSVSAGRWGSHFNRALKRLGVRARDVVVVSALTGDGEGTVMIKLYAVPGVTAERLETEFASAIHQPSSRPWQPTEIAGQRVQVAKDRDFVVTYWAVEGMVFELGASADVDLSDLVSRLK